MFNATIFVKELKMTDTASKKIVAFLAVGVNTQLKQPLLIKSQLFLMILNLSRPACNGILA